MKVIKTLTQEEVERLIPKGALDAMASDEKDIAYCSWCDGYRRNDHICPLKPAMEEDTHQSVSE